MAQTLTVKPQYVNTTQVFLNGKSILLNNNLTQEQLLAIWQRAEFRSFIDITYTNVADSFPENFEIDPNLFHAYDSGEVTHNLAKTDYPANTLGKHLNETRGKIDAFDGAFVRPSTKPILNLDFANSRFLDPRVTVTRSGPSTYVDKNGLITLAGANKPRFTHNPITKECLGLLKDEPKTNYILYSENLENAVWTKGAGGISVSVSPTLYPTLSGDLRACKIIEGTNNGSHTFSQVMTTTGDGKYTLTMFGNAKERANIRVDILANASSTSSGWRVDLNLALGTVVSEVGIGSIPGSGKSEIEIWPDGWFRVEIVMLPANTGNISRTVSVNLMKDGAVSYLGDGVSGLLLDKFQLEQGSSSTSYMPSYGQTVTRGTENVAITGTNYTDIFSQLKEGTVYLNVKKASARGAGEFRPYYRFVGAAGGNYLSTSDGLSETIYNECWKDGINTFNGLSVNMPYGSWFQLAFAFSPTDSICYVNGLPLGGVDTSVSIPDTLNQFFLGDLTTIYRQVSVWSKRLSNEELASITKPNGLVGKKNTQMPSVGDLGGCAFIRPESILRSKSRQEFSIDGTGASLTRNIRRNYDFTFEIVDSSGVTITAQPASSCTAGTDNALTFTAPLGKTLTYAITPVYEN